MDTLVDYQQFEQEEPNLSRGSELVGGTLGFTALAGPAALFAAPAIGGAVGALIDGYSGAPRGWSVRGKALLLGNRRARVWTTPPLP